MCIERAGARPGAARRLIARSRLILSAILLCHAPGAMAQDHTYDDPLDAELDCGTFDDPELSVRGCSHLIKGGEMDGQDLVYVLYNRSKSFAALKRHAEAEADLRRIVKIEPTMWTAHWSLGIALTMQARHDEAEPIFVRAIDLADPEFQPESHLFLAIWRCNVGKSEAAMASFRSAIAQKTRSFDPERWIIVFQNVLTKTSGYQGAADGVITSEFDLALRRYFRSGCDAFMREYYPDGIPGRPAPARP